LLPSAIQLVAAAAIQLVALMRCQTPSIPATPPTTCPQDECCWHHDKCHAEPAAQRAYRHCSMGLPSLDGFLRNFGVACECDAALLKCIERVKAGCEAQPTQEKREACKAKNAYKLSKATDIEVAFAFLDSCAGCPA